MGADQETANGGMAAEGDESGREGVGVATGGEEAFGVEGTADGLRADFSLPADRPGAYLSGAERVVCFGDGGPAGRREVHRDEALIVIRWPVGPGVLVYPYIRVDGDVPVSYADGVLLEYPSTKRGYFLLVVNVGKRAAEFIESRN